MRSHVMLKARHEVRYSHTLICHSIFILSLGYTEKRSKEWKQGIVRVIGLTCESLRFHWMRDLIKRTSDINIYETETPSAEVIKIMNNWDKVSYCVRSGNPFKFGTQTYPHYTLCKIVSLLNHNDGAEMKKTKKSLNKCEPLSCNEGTEMEDLENSLNKVYRDPLPAALQASYRAIANCMCPVFTAAEFNLCAKRNKIRVDKHNLIEHCRTSKSEFDRIPISMKDPCFDQFRSFKEKKDTSKVKYNRVYRDPLPAALQASYRAIANCTCPVFTAAEFNLCAKRHKIRVDKLNLIEHCRTSKSEFDRIPTSMKDLCFDQFRNFKEKKDTSKVKWNPGSLERSICLTGAITGTKEPQHSNFLRRENDSIVLSRVLSSISYGSGKPSKLITNIDSHGISCTASSPLTRNVGTEMENSWNGMGSLVPQHIICPRRANAVHYTPLFFSARAYRCPRPLYSNCLLSASRMMMFFMHHR